MPRLTQRRRDFRTEAERESREIAELAADPDSDEAQVLRELDAAFDAMYQDDEQLPNDEQPPDDEQLPLPSGRRGLFRTEGTVDLTSMVQNEVAD